MGQLRLEQANQCLGANAPALAAGELHLWHWSSDMGSAGGVELLNAHQRTRHDQLATSQLKVDYLSSHTGTRRILAGYLKCPPAKIRFEPGQYGKPRLHANKLNFNLSHSSGQTLLAVSQNMVGVDIERVRPLSHFGSLAEKHLSSDELARLRGVPETDRIHEFFRYWTCKEAIAKLTGLGLQSDVKKLDVGLSELATIAQIDLPQDWPTRLTHCWLAEIEANAGFAAAVASDQPMSRTKVFELQNE